MFRHKHKFRFLNSSRNDNFGAFHYIYSFECLHCGLVKIIENWYFWGKS